MSLLCNKLHNALTKDIDILTTSLALLEANSNDIYIFFQLIVRQKLNLELIFLL